MYSIEYQNYYYYLYIKERVLLHFPKLKLK